VLAILAAVVAVPVCGITGLAVADAYHQKDSWPIAFTTAYLGVAAAWLALVLTTVAGRLRLIVASFLAVLVLLVGVYTFYVVNLA
jgi:hypothetical protein